MTDDLAARFEQLRAEAQEGPVIVDSMIEYFARIVPLLQAMGAKRTGAEPMLHADGRLCMVDTYRLAKGPELRAGYALRAAQPDGASGEG